MKFGKEAEKRQRIHALKEQEREKEKRERKKTREKERERNRKRKKEREKERERDSIHRSSRSTRAALIVRPYSTPSTDSLE